MRALLLLTLLLAATAATAVQLPREKPVPGGIRLVQLPDAATTVPPQVHFGDERVLTLQNDTGWWAVVGLPLSLEPGPQELHLRWGDGGPSGRVVFEVEPTEYASQYLTIKNKRKVNPNEEDMRRIRRENAVIAEAKAHWSPKVGDLSFLRPVEGPTSSPFGLRRFFNQQPRRPHGGLDYAAPEGTPIRAPAPGRVILTGDFFFNGQSVFLDHGQGLISFYAHMSGIDVDTGQWVERGQRIGAVGMTGRVTGPHLHWGVQLNGTWVDPGLFLDQPE